MKKYTYDHRKYNFVKIVQELFDCADLQKLNEKLPAEIQYKEAHKVGEDNKTWFHKVFYKPINDGNSAFQSLYNTFISEVMSQHIQENKFVFQKTPTFRVHAPGNVAVGGWHKDSDYNHPAGEINFIVPLTKAFGENTVWSESKPGLKDFSPFEMEVGEFMQFDGNRCVHGNKLNTTGVCRVSFDFRIIPFSLYKEDETLETISANRKLVLGDYYSLFDFNKII